MTWIKSNRLLSIIILVCIGFFVYYIFNAVSWILYPNSIDYGEGFVMTYAKLWANGTWSWDINTPPYLTMVYGVGFPILATPFVNMFGADLWVGRSLSFISALIVCGLLYLIVKELTGKKSYGLLATLLPATQPIFRDWSVLARVDMPAVMFDMIGFYIVVRFKDSKWLYIAVIPFLCAMMIKLTAIAGLVAVIIYLLISERRRLPLFLGLIIVGLGAMIYPLLVVSGGTYWKHIIVYQNTIQNIDIPVFMLVWRMFFFAFIPLFVASLLYLRRYIMISRITLAGLLFIVAFVVNTVTTFRPGAAGMYYYEVILAGCICTALTYYYFKTHKKLQITIVTSILMVLLLAMYGVNTTMRLPEKQYSDDVNTVIGIISDTDSPVVTENPALVMSANKDLYIETFIFANLARLGYWDETPYIEKYESQYFDYVLLKISLEEKMIYEERGYPDSHFTAGALQAIKSNYTLVFSNKSNDPNEDWRCYFCLYEANDKFKNDDREIVRAIR